MVVLVVVMVVMMDPLQWVGKTGHELFTGSQDGTVKWWDIRSGGEKSSNFK